MFKADLIKKLDAIPDDEPLFLLRGRDPLAPPLVTSWALNAEVKGLHEAKLIEAEAVAVAMADYPIKKLPD